MNYFDEKNVLVVGAGKSGISAVNLLRLTKANIFLYDSNGDTDIVKLKEQIESEDVSIVLGSLPQTLIDKTDLLVLSPGVPTDLDFVIELSNNNVPIWGEIELAYAFSKGTIVGITGTNGKTTTTALTGQIMKEYAQSVFVVGNIGIPYTQIASQTTQDSITVIELSSFQLETIQTFRPNVSMILNITPDHLNRHHTMENYIAAKENITLNQNEKDTCILNYEDEVLREYGESLKCNVLFFSSARKLDKGIYLDKDNIVYSDGIKTTVVVNVTDMNIIGTHNYENAMAAIGAAIAMNVPIDTINSAVTKFVAVEHRIEYVATKKGVKYYNDSKGTNPDAAIKGIQAMKSDTILIGGGYDKGSDYEEWIAAFSGKVKKLVLIGQTAYKIAQACNKMGFMSYVITDTLESAMEIAKNTAISGDCVLLSPACASWGMFKNYEERGNVFKDIVNAMED